MIRAIRSDSDLAAYAALWSSLRPRDAISPEFVQGRLALEPERLYLLAEDEGLPIGCGLTSGSSYPGRKFVVVGVSPERRRLGIGTALLERCLEHARSLGGETAVGSVWEDDEESLAFGVRHGFVEFERGVELVLELSHAQPPAAPPEGIEIVELAPEHHSGAYEIWIEGVFDMPSTDAPSPMPFERWLDEKARSQALVLVALERELVVGFAALEDRHREAGVGGNDLTTVRRSHRRRGIAEALKRTQLAWAAEHGYRSIVTGTDEENVGMRRLNEKLGYRPLPASILLRRSLVESR
jgi:mycothiol synthase